MTQLSTPMKLCECGCGLAAPIADRNDSGRGNVKGQPQRFILGHSAKTRMPAVAKRYRWSHRDDGVRLRLHIARAERALGKQLPAGAVVHHADGSKRDDAPLVICQDAEYHRLLHARMHIIAAGGNPNADAVCGRCTLAKPRDAFNFCAAGIFGVQKYCKECSREASRRWRQ